MRSGLILKKEKNIQASDSDEFGDIYTLTAMKTDTRLFLSHHEGGRTTEDVIALFRDVEQRRSIYFPIPVFTSDNWDAFEEGLVNICGYLENPTYKGTGRRPLPVLVPHADLKYAQVSKRKIHGRVVEVVQRVIFGDHDDVIKALDADSGGKINTAYIERLNLTIRNCIARFIRKGMNCSKALKRHSNVLDFFQAWYNLVKSHQSLKVEINLDGRKWMYRTPVMAEGITDHIWNLKELMTFKVPIQ